MEAPAGRDAAPLPWQEFICLCVDQRGRALRIFAAVLGVALAVAAFLPPSFRATAVLAVLPSPEYTVRPAAGSHEFNASALALDQIMKAETEILQSDDLHAATLRRVGPATVYQAIYAPGDAGPILAWLRRLVSAALSPWRTEPGDPAAARTARGLRRFSADLNVLPTKDSNVITITFDNPDGAVAATTINAMLALYAARRSRLYDDPQMEIVRREADVAGGALAGAEMKLADFKHGHAIYDFDQQRRLLLQRRSAADQALSDAGTVAAENHARLQALDRAAEREPQTVGIYEERDSDTRLQAVNASLLELRAKVAAEAEKYTSTSRLMTMLRSQIAASEAEAARLRGEPALSVVRRGRNPALDPMRLDRDRAEAEMAASLARIGTERAEQAEITGALDRLDAAETALLILQRDRATAEEDYHVSSRILAERRLSEAEDKRRLANVRVIQPATEPQFPRPLKLLVIAAGLLFGGLGSAGWIIARFVFRPVFLTAPGLEAATGMPVLAVFGSRPTWTPTAETLPAL
jgi:uncharacterized protein involved in exopolysaccharide biosynthesis